MKAKWPPTYKRYYWLIPLGLCLCILAGVVLRLLGPTSPISPNFYEGQAFQMSDLQPITAKNVTSLAVLGTFGTENGYPAAFSTNDQYLALSNPYIPTVIVSLEDKRVYQQLNDHPKEAFIWSAAFSPDDRLLVTGDERGQLHFWDVKTGKLLRQMASLTQTSIRSIVFNPDGTQLAYLDNGGVGIIDLKTLAVQYLKKDFLGDKALNLVFSSQGFALITYKNETIQVWLAEHWNAPLHILPFHPMSDPSYYMQLIPDANLTRLTIVDFAEGFQIWDLETNSLISATKNPYSGGSMGSAIYNADQTLLIVGDGSVWDMRTTPTQIDVANPIRGYRLKISHNNKIIVADDGFGVGMFGVLAPTASPQGTTTKS